MNIHDLLSLLDAYLFDEDEKARQTARLQLADACEELDRGNTAQKLRDKTVILYSRYVCADGGESYQELKDSIDITRFHTYDERLAYIAGMDEYDSVATPESESVYWWFNYEKCIQDLCEMHGIAPEGEEDDRCGPGRPPE